MTWPEIMELFVNQVGQFIVCILTSYVFVYVLLKTLSPNIKISGLISKQNIAGQDVYIFKAVNLSKFDAYNVRFTLLRRIPYIQDNKVNHRVEEVPLRKQETFSIPKFKKDKTYGDYAALIGTNIDISTDIGVNNTEYELAVSVCHGLSNLTKVDRMIFDNASLIRNRHFKFGNSLEVSN